jgi:hypothetical protein
MFVGDIVWARVTASDKTEWPARISKVNVETESCVLQLFGGRGEVRLPLASLRRFAAGESPRTADSEGLKFAVAEAVTASKATRRLLSRPTSTSGPGVISSMQPAAAGQIQTPTAQLRAAMTDVGVAALASAATASKKKRSRPQTDISGSSTDHSNTVEEKTHDTQDNVCHSSSPYFSPDKLLAALPKPAKLAPGPASLAEAGALVNSKETVVEDREISVRQPAFPVAQHVSGRIISGQAVVFPKYNASTSHGGACPDAVIFDCTPEAKYLLLPSANRPSR